MSSFCPNIDEWLFPQFEHVPPAVTDLRRNDIFIKFFFEFTLFVFLFQWFLVIIHFFKSFFFNAAGQVWDVPMIWQLGVPGDGYWSTRGLFSHASFIQKNLLNTTLILSKYSIDHIKMMSQYYALFGVGFSNSLLKFLGTRIMFLYKLICLNNLKGLYQTFKFL